MNVRTISVFFRKTNVPFAEIKDNSFRLASNETKHKMQFTVKEWSPTGSTNRRLIWLIFIVPERSFTDKIQLRSASNKLRPPLQNSVLPCIETFLISCKLPFAIIFFSTTVLLAIVLHVNSHRKSFYKKLRIL